MITIAPALKDKAILLGWITGLLLAAILLWALSFNFRSMRLMHTANRILVSMNDERRLAAPVSPPVAGPVPIGNWYRLAEPTDADSWFFVFVIMWNGILVPCGAQVNTDGQVTDILPLGSHAKKVIDRIPQGIMHMYINRIESAVIRGIE